MEIKTESQNMLLLKFNPSDFKDCNTVAQIYQTIGISPASAVDDNIKWEDKDVFGERAYYKNMFLCQEDYGKAERALKKNVLTGRTLEGNTNPEETMMDYKERGEVFSWAMNSPVSTGPKYDKIVERLEGDIPTGVLVIVCPGDDLYEEAPEA